MYEEIVLSEKYKIYKTKYNWEFPRENFVERIYQNRMVGNNLSTHTHTIVFDCDEFDSIHNLVYGTIKSFTNKNPKEYSTSWWSFIQEPNFQQEFIHTHPFVYASGFYDYQGIKIKNDWTFVFYIQIPQNIVGTEGNILFVTEDKQKHYFLPENGDIFIFPWDIRHSALPSPNAEKDRISLQGNYSLNFLNDTRDEIMFEKPVLNRTNLLKKTNFI